MIRAQFLAKEELLISDTSIRHVPSQCVSASKAERSVFGGSLRSSHRTQGGFSINSTFDQVTERLTLAAAHKGFWICFRSWWVQMNRGAVSYLA